MKKNAEGLLLGAHTSAAGGVHNALLEGRNIGASTIQLFTANQRRWDTKLISIDEIELWQRCLQETGLKQIMSHDSYLINLGAPDPNNLIKSRIAFKLEVERALSLKLSYVNFHPGAAVGSSVEDCLGRIVESLLELKPLFGHTDLKLLLETTAGQGSVVGYRFEELAYIIEKVHRDIPIGVCIDTCHIFAAGYDIRTPEAWDLTLKEFDRIIGLKYLDAFHLNDSQKGLGSRVDRHMPLGKGQIGLECFRFLVNDPRTCHLPMYLETPDGPELWAQEITLLKELKKS